MATLFDLLLRSAELLRETRPGTATGGTETTLVDAALDYPDGYFTGGTLFFTSGALAGRTAVVTAHAGGTLTFIPPVNPPRPVAAGDAYVALSPHYTREDLRQAVAQTLEEIGTFTQVDTTLVSDSEAEEYFLPEDVHHVVRVMVARNDTEPFRWTIHRHWRQIGRTLYLDEPLHSDGMPVRLLHNARHAPLSADSDPLDDNLSGVLGRLAVTVAYYAALRRAQNVGDQEPKTGKLVEALAEQKSLLAMFAPIPRYSRDTRLSRW